MRDPVFRGIVDCLATQSIDEIPDLPTFPDFEIDPFL